MIQILIHNLHFLLSFRRKNLYLRSNMDEDSSHLYSKPSELPYNFANDSIYDKKGNPAFFFDPNGGQLGSHQMLSLQSPPTFKREILVNLNEESENEREYYDKSRKEEGLGGIFQINFHGSSYLESQEVEKYNEGRRGKKSKSARNTEKGLKRLSKHVYEIILSLKNATYKQIAEELLTKFNKKISDNDSRHLQPKVEQNIRRRVYDALNVLIAAGVLEKNGKKVSYEGKMKSEIKTEVDSICSEDPYSNRYQGLLANKQKILQQKRQRLQVLQNQYSGLKSLVQRNAKNEHKNKINFPAVSFVYQSVQKPWTICKKKSQFCVKVKKLIKIEGDLDLISRLKVKGEEEERKMRSKSKFNKFS